MLVALKNFKCRKCTYDNSLLHDIEFVFILHFNDNFGHRTATKVVYISATESLCYCCDSRCD